MKRCTRKEKLLFENVLGQQVGQFLVLAIWPIEYFALSELNMLLQIDGNGLTLTKYLVDSGILMRSSSQMRKK